MDIEKVPFDVGRERRRYARLAASSEARLIAKNGAPHHALPGRVLNVSPTGICYELGKQYALAAGDSATVVWRVPPELGYTLRPKTYKLTGTIVRVAAAEGAVYTLGIKFAKLLPEQVQRINTRPQRLSAVAMAISASCIDVGSITTAQSAKAIRPL